MSEQDIDDIIATSDGDTSWGANMRGAIATLKTRLAADVGDQIISNVRAVTRNGVVAVQDTWKANNVDDSNGATVEHEVTQLWTTDGRFWGLRPMPEGVGSGDYLRYDFADPEWEFVVGGVVYKASDIGATIGDVAAHEAAADPHAQYLTEAEGDARYTQPMQRQILPFAASATSGGTPSISFADVYHREITLTGNLTSLTMNPVNWAPAGNVDSRRVTIRQDATGGRTIDVNALGGTWAYGDAPTVDLAANAVALDYLVETNDGGATLELVSLVPVTPAGGAVDETVTDLTTLAADGDLVINWQNAGGPRNFRLDTAGFDITGYSQSNGPTAAQRFRGFVEFVNNGATDSTIDLSGEPHGIASFVVAAGTTKEIQVSASGTVPA